MSSINAGSTALQAPDDSSPGTRMLVCATEPDSEQVLVSLADGAYESGQERIFWRDAPDCTVLRLPRQLPFATRPVRSFPRQRSRIVSGGESALLHAVRASQGRPELTPPEENLAQPLVIALAEALSVGDADLAFAYAVQLVKQSGLQATYEVMSRCLAQLASSWAIGTGTVLAEHRATRAVERVTDRLNAQTPLPTLPGTVLLAVPPGEQHTVALDTLGHQLRDAGRAVRIVGELPPAELVTLAAEPSTLAVVMSLHTPRQAAAVRSLLRRLREAAPDVLLVLGGPAVLHRSSTTFGADLITQHVPELLLRLESRSSALTEREAEVLTAVAAGHTTAEIAGLLGVAPSTVKSHLDNILVKTDTVHRAAAVAVGLRRGWIA